MSSNNIEWNDVIKKEVKVNKKIYILKKTQW